MTFRRSSPAICLGAAALAVGGLLVCNAQQQGKQRARPIEFSLPKGETVSTNMPQVIGKPDDMKQWKEELLRPSQSFSPQSSLDGVIALPVPPPTASAIPSKRVKELLERRKNWVFMGPEDLLGAPTVDEVLKTPELGPDGKEQKEPPALQRFYNRTTAKRSPTDDLLQSRTEALFGAPTQTKPSDDATARDEANLPKDLRQAAEKLQKLFEPGARGDDNPFIQGATHGDLSDTFGLGYISPPKEQIQEHKKFMTEYNSVLDLIGRPPKVATPDNPLATLADTAAPAAKSPAGLPGLPSTIPQRGSSPPNDVINPVLGPLPLPDVNAQALGQTTLGVPLPQAQPVRLTPVIPSFDAPRRAFR